MAKNNRQGKAAVWTPKTIALLRRELKTPRQRLAFEISLWTGERMGAIVQLKVSDVYDDRGKVRETINFGGRTRKSSKHGIALTRQIFIHDVLRNELSRYNPPGSGYLFCSHVSRSGHITARSVDDYWRRILTSHGYYGFSTHSSRRWVINKLRQAGIGLVTISEAMAISIATVRKYLDDDPVACKNAIATLSV